MNDLDLLHQYARENSQDAFAELVKRHLNLVYSVALRQVKSPQLAEDVVQSVFLTLSRKAGSLKPETLLAAWLYRVTRHAASDLMRGESRRQLREQTAMEIAEMKSDSSSWPHVEPFLDEALESLDEKDRHAILLRFFESKSLREVGQALGTSEDGAQKRVSRAVEELRTCFSRRGIALTSAGVVAVLTVPAAQAAPCGLGAAILSSAALSASPKAGAFVIAKGITMTTIQKTCVVAVFAVAVGTSIYEARRASAKQEELEVLQQQQRDASKNLRATRLPAPRIAFAPRPDRTTAQMPSPSGSWSRFQTNGKSPTLTSEQAQSYLEKNKRNAASLVAAFRATGDKALLMEAMEKYPHDSFVMSAALLDQGNPPHFQSPTGEDRRQWLDSFKRGAPDNALAVCLSANDYFASGQMEQAVQEVSALAGKSSFQNYQSDSFQNREEAFLAAGYSPADASAAAAEEREPEFIETRQFFKNLADLAQSYLQTGDQNSSQAVLQLGDKLGQMLVSTSGQNTLAEYRMGIEAQNWMLGMMDPNAPYGENGQTVQNRLSVIAQSQSSFSDLVQQMKTLLPTLPDDELVAYYTRQHIFGGYPAMQWLVGKYGNQ